LSPPASVPNLLTPSLHLPEQGPSWVGGARFWTPPCGHLLHLPLGLRSYEPSFVMLYSILHCRTSFSILCSLQQGVPRCGLVGCGFPLCSVSWHPFFSLNLFPTLNGCQQLAGTFLKQFLPLI
jgi:hypothetical protein